MPALFRAAMDAPTFDSLMSDSRRTPRREPVLDHTAVTRNAVDYLTNAGWPFIETEVWLPKTPEMKKVRIADVVAWNRSEREVFIVESKASWNDFQRDRKFMEYKDWCHLMAFAVPEELATAARLWMDERNGPRAYGGVGLLVIPNDFGRRRMVRRPERRLMANSAYLMVVEQLASSMRSRLVGVRIQITEWEYKWKARNLEARKGAPCCQ